MKGVEMKLYSIYLTVPTNIWENYLKRLVANAFMFKESSIKPDHMFGLYAWTTKKSMVDAFMEYRHKDIYTIREQPDISKYDMLMYKEKWADQKIQEAPIISEINRFNISYDDALLIRQNDKKASMKATCKSLYLTKFEYVNITEYHEENWMEFGINAEMPYKFFNDKIIHLLDVIGYTLLHDVFWSMNGGVLDDASYQLSFNLTPYGNPVPFSISNELGLLCYFYRYPIFGSRDEDAFEDVY